MNSARLTSEDEIFTQLVFSNKTEDLKSYFFHPIEHKKYLI